jgi:hypothetical protein
MSDRLYYGPSHTVDVVGAVISGNDTIEKLAEQLDLGERTVINKVHDPRVLGLIEKEEESFEASDDARRLIQLQDRSVLEEPLRGLAGVDEVLEQLDGEELTTEEVGRIISFETESGASTPQRFRDYGSVYAKWLDFLDLGEVTDSSTGSDGPLTNDSGANHPLVRPPKVIDGLRNLDQVETADELANRLGCSKREANKIIRTCYALEVAKPKVGSGFTITDSGRTVLSTSQGKQRELLRNALLEIPMVEAYCERTMDGDYKNIEILREVSDDFNMGWGDETIRTRSKRIYRWVIYTKLAEETSRGHLEPTERMPSAASLK